MSRPFLYIRIGGLRLTLEHCPRRILTFIASVVGTLSGVLALHH
jgi:hypothetical protein